MTRPSASIQVLTCAAFAAIAVYFVGWHRHEQVSARGTDRVLVNLIPVIPDSPAGASITQVFQPLTDGLHAIDLQMNATAPADVVLQFAIGTMRDGVATERMRWRVQVRASAGEWTQRIEFPEFTESGGQAHALTVRLLDVRPLGAGPAEVALVASRDRPLRHSALIVTGVERWGSLVFDAHARGETVLGRLGLRNVPVIVAALAVYLAVLLAVLLRIVTAVPETTSSPDQSGGLWPRLRGAVITVVIVALSGAAVWAGWRDRGAMSLVDDLGSATLEAAMPLHKAFDVLDVELGVDTRRSVLAHPTSRIAWPITVPPKARFRTDVGLLPVAWNHEGDGVSFRVLAEVEGRPTLLAAKHVNPLRNPLERRWTALEADLSDYAGRTITLILETWPSEPGVEPDPRYDLAIWGEPRVTARGLQNQSALLPMR